MPTISTDITTSIYDVPGTTVSVCQALGDDWEVVPYLYPVYLRVTAAPEIGTCTLIYDYGPQIRPDETEPDQYAPLDYRQWFVKVEIPDSVGDDDITWYGILEPDHRTPAGTSDIITDAHGRQTLTAYDLKRLLEITPVNTAFVEQADTTEEPIEIGRGLSFNADDRGAWSQRGNRSASRRFGDDDNDVYVFAYEPRGTFVWTAFQAAEYLLSRHMVPPIFHRWALVADEALLDWYDIAVRTDSRSVKSILDELIPRRRGVGYTVEYDEAASELQVVVFGTLAEDLELPTGTIVPATENQYTLDFELAVDVQAPTVTNIPNAQYHRIVARGGFRTSTCTLSLDSAIGALQQFVGDWTSAEQTSWIDGPSGVGTLDPVEQYLHLDQHRRSDELRHVFSRFVLYPGWNQRTLDWTDEGGSADYFVHPTLNSDGTPRDEYSASPSAPNEHGNGLPLWTAGLTILPRLPLQDGLDYSGTNIADDTFAGIFARTGQPEFLPPVALIAIDDRYELLDQLAGGGLETGGRPFSVDLATVSTAPAIELRTRGKPQQFLAPTDFAAGSGVADPEDDPATDGLDFYGVLVTLCLQTDDRVEEEVQLDETPPGVQERILYLDVPDARLDYVVPKTIIGVDNGDVVQTDSGGFVRDDRPRLQHIARMAAEWYGRTRQTLRVPFKQARQLVRIGWLITEIGAAYNLTDINTPVTAIEYRMGDGPPTTTIETSYAALDFM